MKNTGRYSFLFFLVCLLGTNAACFAQATVSGVVKDKSQNTMLPYANIVLNKATDSSFVSGTISDDKGRFTLPGVVHGDYIIRVSIVGYNTQLQKLFVGESSKFLEMPPLLLEKSSAALEEVVVRSGNENISGKMEKKTYSMAENYSQAGGSLLQAMQNLPGVTTQEGKIQLRGSDKVIILIDGKQTALTGFGNQSGLDNIPASAIDRIELINNPSSKYDANGNAGIINVILKKEKKKGFNGKAGLTAGLGALWERKENLPDVRPQYRMTPKINPSLSLNYRKEKVNIFLQADNLYTQTLNKNEFVVRTYDDGTVVNQQTKRNRNTNFFTSKAGIDWNINSNDVLTVSGLLGTEKIIDRGDQPFFNEDKTQLHRLWTFLEDELKTTVMASAAYQHRYSQPGRLLSIGFNYTYHRENEKYFFDNAMPTYTGKDAFKLISDEHVSDLNIDYVQPLRYGKVEAGVKFRYRDIPTDMLFIPGLNSPLDSNAGGWAVYRETIPALYGNYVIDNKKIEAELGIRLEYMNLQYDVNPSHPVYKSDGYDYFQPFPNLRFAYKINDRNRISVFYNRRVDRPNEVDIRIFPKYDDAEIIKVGNPALRPQFTNSIELGYKNNFAKGSFYGALYHRFSDGTITRIATTVPGSNIIYAIFQNAGKSYVSGAELLLSQTVSKKYSFSLNANGYHNQINAFTVENRYPTPHSFSAAKQSAFSGNVKFNNNFSLANKAGAQLSIVWLAPDIIPQGKIASRFSVDAGFKKALQKGRGELFINANDLFNTMVIKKHIQGNDFKYSSADYYETQVFRLGYSYKF